MAQPITITEFTGQAENPHIGSGVAVGVDLYTTKNVARLSRTMSNHAPGLIAEFPLYITQGQGMVSIPAEINYTQIIPTPPFDIGELVTGLTSGATGTIATNTGAVMTLTGVTGTFIIGETIKGAISNGEGIVDAYFPPVMSSTNPVIFVQDEIGNIYQSIDQANTWTQLFTSVQGGYGIMIWEDYLFMATPNDINVYGPLGGTPTLTSGWWTANNGPLQDAVDIDHVMFINPSLNQLYICNGRYIAYVQLSTPTAVFDPANTATFFTSNTAFIMPEFYIAVTIGFLPPNLVGIGVANTLNNSQADVVMWGGDITNNTATNVVNVPGATGPVTQLLTRNGIMYAITNYEHGVYTINGYSAQNIDRLALRMSNRLITGEQYTTRLASTIYPDGADFLGPELLTAGSNNPSPVSQISGTGLYPYGVWSVNIENKVTGLRYPLSFGAINALYTSDYSIGFVKVLTSGVVVVGWQVDGTNGIDVLDPQNYITDATVVFVESSLYEVGTRSQPAVFEELEYNLVTPLHDGETITWYWRGALSDPYQQFHTENFATLGTNTSDIITPLPFGERQYIQIAFSFTSSVTTNNLTPQIRSMILRSEDSQ